ncbi:MAG: ATP-binding cassette domain-containing protein [Xanthobacteraceae bacterium]
MTNATARCRARRADACDRGTSRVHQISVTDDLLLAGYDMSRAVRIEEALSSFPQIAEKRHERGGALSGGQQQMLTWAQDLVRRPRLLMLDEPSAGLSPVLVDQVLNVIGRLREQGTSVLLVEQLLEKAPACADRAYALVQGAIALEAPTGESGLAHRLERAYFGHESHALGAQGRPFPGQLKKSGLARGGILA